MRYVIGVLTVAFFVIWDGLYNDGLYIDSFIGELLGLTRMIGI